MELMITVFFQKFLDIKRLYKEIRIALCFMDKTLPEVMTMFFQNMNSAGDDKRNLKLEA